MDYLRILCTRRREYTFANGVRNVTYVDRQNPPAFVALPENRLPPTEAQLELRRIQSEQRRARAEEREAENRRLELESVAARQLEIRQAAQEIVSREVGNLREYLMAEINRIRDPEPPEVQIIAVMPMPLIDLYPNGVFFFNNI